MRSELSRFPRSSLFYFALVVVLGLIFWFTWSSIQNNQSTNDWTYSMLMNQAAEGNVKSVDISGTDGTAIDLHNTKHSVVLPDCSGECAFVTTLRQDPAPAGGT